MDLRFYFAEAAGELGVRSGFEAFVALMMTGASKDGGTIAQPTSAQVDRVWAGRETVWQQSAWMLNTFYVNVQP
jgi:hypothetical protein